jgi:hypothetical protein
VTLSQPPLVLIGYTRFVNGYGESSLTNSSYSIKLEIMYPLKKPGQDLRGFSRDIYDIQFNTWISIRKPRRSGLCPKLLSGYEIIFKIGKMYNVQC